MSTPTPVVPQLGSAGRAALAGRAGSVLGGALLSEQTAAALAAAASRRAVAVTATGPIYLIPGRVRWAPPAAAFQRLQELHQRALGEAGPFITAAPRTLTPQQAFRAYSNSLIVVLAQLAILGPEGRANITVSLADFVAARGSLDGLEGILITAARAAQRSGDKRGLAAAAAAFGRVGLPAKLGGGARMTPVLDVRSGQLVLASMPDLLRVGLSRGGVSGSAGDMAGLSTSLSGIFATPALDPGRGGTGPLAGSLADNIQIGAAIGGFLGAIAGGIIGSLGGPPGTAAGIAGGAATGAQLGAVVGGAIAIALEVRIETTPPAPPGEPSDGGAPPGGTGDPPGGGGGGGGGGDGGGGGGGGDGGGDPPAPDPGGGGEGGFPNPDDPGGNDGGQVTPTRVPTGPGLDALTTFHGGTSFTIGGLPAIGDGGDIRSGGFLSGVPGFGVSDPEDSSGGGFAGGSVVGGRAPIMLPSRLVVDPLPDALADALLQRLATAAAHRGPGPN